MLMMIFSLMLPPMPPLMPPISMLLMMTPVFIIDYFRRLRFRWWYYFYFHFFISISPAFMPYADDIISLIFRWYMMSFLDIDTDAYAFAIIFISITLSIISSLRDIISFLFITLHFFSFIAFSPLFYAFDAFFFHYFSFSFLPLIIFIFIADYFFFFMPCWLRCHFDIMPLSSMLITFFLLPFCHFRADYAYFDAYAMMLFAAIDAAFHADAFSLFSTFLRHFHFFDAFTMLIFVFFSFDYAFAMPYCAAYGDITRYYYICFHCHYVIAAMLSITLCFSFFALMFAFSPYLMPMPFSPCLLKIFASFFTYSYWYLLRFSHITRCFRFSPYYAIIDGAAIKMIRRCFHFDADAAMALTFLHASDGDGATLRYWCRQRCHYW